MPSEVLESRCNACSIGVDHLEILGRLLLAVLQHSLWRFNPETLIIRRVRKSERRKNDPKLNLSETKCSSSRAEHRKKSSSVEAPKLRSRSAEVARINAAPRSSLERSAELNPSETKCSSSRAEHRKKSSSAEAPKLRSRSAEVARINSAPRSSRRSHTDERRSSGAPPSPCVSGGEARTPMVGLPPLATASQSTQRGANRRQSSSSRRQKARHSDKRVGLTFLCGRLVAALKPQFSSRKVVKTAMWLHHFSSNIPVALVHFLCDLQLQISAVPILSRFALNKSGKEVLNWEFWRSSGESGDASPEVTLWFSLRIFFSLLASYLQDNCFLDNTLVLGQLRSRRYLKRFTGWALRVTAHTLLDPVFLSVLSPLLCVQVKDFSAATPLRYTLPGLLKGMGLSVVAVCIQHFISPVITHLINRSMVTVCEAVEYVFKRRYEYIDAGIFYPESSSASEVGSLGGDSVRGTPRRHLVADDEAINAKLRQQEEVYKQQRDERRRLRTERQLQQEARAEQAIVRAILYRMASALVAQCIIEHPLHVLKELLLGRAVMHLTGLSVEYDAASLAFPITGEGLHAYVEHLRSAHRDVPSAISLLRCVWLAGGTEAYNILRCVVAESGEWESIRTISQRVNSLNGASSSVVSASLAWHSFLGITSLYNGVGFSVIDSTLTFYIATWRRLMS